MMKYKNLFFAVCAIALAACSDNLTENASVVTPPSPEPPEVPVLFGPSSNGVTRAEFTDAVAADLLGSQFVVSGYKGNTTASMGSMVFDNYKVRYYANTANTTESNSCNWEYVGQDRIKHAIDNGVTQQAIKYWDYSKAQYDFIAWSTGKVSPVYVEPANGVQPGTVFVSAITPDRATGPDGIAYTFKGSAADLEGCYVADLVTVKKANYGSPVTIKFRSLGSKVRIGIYETIPGYSVKDVKFYTAADKVLPADATKPRLFTTTESQIFTSGTYTVFYPTVDNPANTDNNQAHIRFSGTTGDSKIVDFGLLNYTIAEDGERTNGAVFLGRSANTASMAGKAESNYYSQYLPNESGTSLNLRVDYTLESIDGVGETIEVKGATAQVPSIYTQWKPGYAYTYLFKISDKTNGYTGVYDPTNPDNTTVNSDPVGLYPITFDAVVVNDEEDASQETITLVSTPSITTYQKGSKIVDNNEYFASTGDIYITVNDGNRATTPDLANSTLQTLTNSAALYSLSPNRNYTEAEVVDALQIQEDNPDREGTIQGRNGVVLTPMLLTLTNKVEYGVDGNAISVGTDQAAVFTPTSGTYAFVYTKQASSGDSWRFEPVNLPLGKKPIVGYWRYAYMDAPAGDAQRGVAYFDKNTGPKGMFLGQGVSNLYTRSGEGTSASPYVYTIASGLAMTDTDYYYTTDHGMSYKKAVNIPYARFKGATDIYTLSGTTYVQKPSDVATPVDGTAYYKKNDDGSYTYCVILPEQTYSDLKILTSYMEPCVDTDQVLEGQTYFDRYFKNDGVYYVKVIKVQ